MKLMHCIKTAKVHAALIVISILFSGSLKGDDSYIQLPGSEESDRVQVVVKSSDFSGIRVTLAIPGISHCTVKTKGGDFAAVSFKDYGFTVEKGKPRIPVIRELFEIPYEAKGTIEIIDAEYKEFTFAELGIENLILPLQAPVEKLPGAIENALFGIDDAEYSRDEWLLDKVVDFNVEGFLRGSRIGMMEVFPINYNPVANKIRVLVKAEVKISFTGSDMQGTIAGLERYSTGGFDRLASRLFKNYNLFRSSCLNTGRRATTSTGYLIIAHPSFVLSPSLQNFITSRNASGFEVTLVDSATAGTTKENIQSYVKTAVNTWPVPPEYLLLVGDTNHIAVWTGKGDGKPKTDIYYGVLDSADYFPDIFLGRFSVTQESQIENLVNKILAMDATILKESVFMSSIDNWNITEGTHNYVINNYLRPENWRYDKLYCKTYKAKTHQVTSAFNAGKNLAIFSGHGGVTFWDDGPYFSQNNVTDLTNSIYPVVLSFACVTGQFTSTECFAETWIRDENAGVLFWGSSVNSYWDEDDVLQKKVIEGWIDQDKNHFCEMGDYGKLKLYQYLGGGGTARRYFEMYNIMGDPAQKIIGETQGGSFTNFGVGISSSIYGQPTCTGHGDLNPGGNGFELTYESVKPMSDGLLFVGFSNSGGLPFKGGNLYPFPINLTLPFAVDVNGSYVGYAVIPHGYPTNIHFYIQSFFFDSTGPNGVTATDGLDIWIE